MNRFSPSALGALCAHPLVRALAEEAEPRPVHLVGGVVRDALLERPLKDFDAVVAGGGLDLAQRLAARLPARLVRLGGERFAALRLVLADGTVLDLWDRGEDPHNEEGFDADLERRDLTINAIALEPVSGEIRDPFDGLGDLARRRLRATSPGVFADDPLRVLRLARFAAELPGFQALRETRLLARAASPALGTVARERIRDELDRTLRAGSAARGLAMLAHVSVYPGLWLGEPPMHLDGRRPHQGAPCRMAALEREARRLTAAEPELFAHLALAEARWAASFLPLPSPAAALARMAERGYLFDRLTPAIRLLLEAPPLPADPLGRRQFFAHYGELWPTVALFRTAVSGDPAERERIAGLIELAKAEGAALWNLPRLLDGAEVQALLSLPPGPEIGRALARLRQAQIEGRVRTKDEAGELLRGEPGVTSRSGEY